MSMSPSSSLPPDERLPDAPPKLCATGPDLNDLAAYIDGRITDPERQAIDTHLQECGACRDAVDDARQARLEGGDDSMVFVPPAVIEAATALVCDDRAARLRSVPRWVTVVRRGVAVAALVAICFAGHAVGTLIAGSHADSSDSLGVAMSFGLTDSSDQSADDGELFAASLSEASS